MSKVLVLREELRDLIQEANKLIRDEGDYFTQGAKEAMEDTIKFAEETLEYNDHVPFIRHREFYKNDEETALSFAKERYTMVPTYIEKGVYTYYGLAPALKWFKTQHYGHQGERELKEKLVFITAEIDDFKKIEVRPNEVGDFDRTKLKQLEDFLKQSKCLEGQELAKAVVNAFDLLRELRFSKMLKTDKISEPLFLNEEQIKKLKEKSCKERYLKEELEQIQEIAHQNTLGQLKMLKQFEQVKLDYQTLNKHFYLWSSTERTVNFMPPKNASKAKISFILPREENEENDGLGHVWIDNVSVLNSTGSSWNIKNSGFEKEGEKDKPKNWKGKALQGNPKLSWESNYPFCGNEKHSIYIENPTSKDEGMWQYVDKIEVNDTCWCTLIFNAKLDGKLKKGLKVIIEFEDVKGNKLEEFVYFFNKKSAGPKNIYALTMQADAIMYALTGEKEYGEKAKLQMQYVLNDFCQGAEYWMITNLRPDNSDAYGAVQGGRIMCSLAATYTFIKDKGIFNNEEKAYFYRQLEYFLRYLLDLRDRTELTDQQAQNKCSNWQTDMCVGTGMMMMVLEDFPHRKTWLYNAIKVLKAQLIHNVNEDYSWPESIRYNQVAIGRFSLYARLLKNITGEDWFKETPLGRMFGYALEVQTPTYSFYDNHISTPPFGDHTLTDGSEFAIYGLYLREIEKVDKTLADKMYVTWQKAGCPRNKFWTENVACENLLVDVSNYQIEENFEFKLRSTNQFKNAGVYIFRKNFGKEDESYLAIMSSPKKVAHGHLDQGSFIMYKNGIPIVLDSGIEGYFDSSTEWHLSSYSHACLQFKSKKKFIKEETNKSINLSAGTYSLERGFVDVPCQSEVLDFEVNENWQRIKIAIVNPEGEGRHIRTITFMAEDEIYFINDKIEDFEGKVCFNLPVVSQYSKIHGQRVYSKGVFDIDLETIFLGEIEEIKIEKGRAAEMFPKKERESCILEYIRATADASKGVHTVLYPKHSEMDSLVLISKEENEYIIKGKNNISFNLITGEIKF